MKQFFCIVETHFSTNASFQVVEMDFLASTNHKLILRLLEAFFYESFIPAIGEGFSLYWKPSILLESSFLLVKIVTDLSGNHFLKIKLAYSCQWKLIFQLVETIFFPLPQIFFKKFFIPASGNTFSCPEEKVLFFTQNFFSCQWKPLFKLQRSLFKTLITAISNDFL